MSPAALWLVALAAALLALAVAILWFVIEYRAIDRMIRADLAHLRALDAREGE